MKIVLCGLPFIGKSTVFKALLGKQTKAQTTGAGKIQLNIATLELKDKRLEELGRMLHSQKITYPKISLIDLLNPGEKKAADKEISHLREFDALALVVGVFAGKDPLADWKNIEAELILADLQVAQNRIAKINKEKKAMSPQEAQPQLELLRCCAQALEKETFIKELQLGQEELKILAGFQFLTLKPMIVIANIAEQHLGKDAVKDLAERAKTRGLPFISFCAKLEAEIEELPEEERPKFIQEMGLEGLSKDRFIQTSLQALDLISFFTVVGKEARAWLIPRNSSALNAAGCVHSDMQRGFIRAEVINYQQFLNLGTFARAKEQGLLRLESKEYTVQDGDIINFKFSV